MEVQRGDIVWIYPDEEPDSYYGSVGIVMSVRGGDAFVSLFTHPSAHGYGINCSNLKVLGHIDVAPEQGEKRCAEET